MITLINFWITLAIFLLSGGYRLLFNFKIFDAKNGFLSTNYTQVERSVKILEFKPFTTLIASAVVGILITKGVIDPSQKDAVQASLDAFFGGLIILFTAGAALHRYVIKHPTASTKTSAPDTTPHLDA